MALKPQREEFHHDIRFYMNEVAERGGVVCVSTAGSGGRVGDNAAVVTYAANPSGKLPVGILLCDMVNLDLSRYHINFYREQVPLGYKVPLAKDGWYTTNFVLGTPTGGDAAYLGPSGNLCTAAGFAAAVAAGTTQTKVGQFLTKLDEDGYAAVRIEL
jgi:hypothetical protein